MELYALYYEMVSTMWTLNKTGVQYLYVSLIMAALVWAVLFVLQGIGVYTIAKRDGREKKWMAFVPFANIWYIGKISGECTVFGQKLKRAGLYAMLAQIALTLICALEIIGMIYLWTTQGTPSFDAYYPYWGEAQGAALAMAKYLAFYNGFIRVSIQVVYEIMMFIILMGIYKKYVPSSYFILSVVSLFVPLARCIILFVIRNKQKVDYDAYMRKKREEYMRNHGYSQNGTPYGTPYGYNPNPNPQQQGKPEDPFEEFNQGKNGGGDHDDFFS